MKVTAEHLPEHQIALTVELEDEATQRGLDRAYRKLANRYTIPGFRKGKAPRYIVESMLGRDLLLEEAAKELVPKAYEEAITSEGVEPYAEPELEITRYEPLSFKAVVPLRPIVRLGDYQSIELQPESVEVQDADVDRVLQQLQDQRATWHEPTEPRAVEPGDRVVVEVEAFAEGQPIGDGPEDVTADVGSGQIFEPIDQKLRGMQIGERQTVEMTLPEDYPKPQFAGKPAIFQLHLKEIKVKDAPALDDEFARTAGGAENLAGLREEIRENLHAQREAEARQKLYDAAVNLLVERSEIEVPPVVVYDEMHRLMDRMESALSAQKISLEQYLRQTGKSEAEFEEEFRPRARTNVLRALALREFAGAEGLSVSTEELESELKQMMGEGEPEQLRTAIADEGVRRMLEGRVLERKTADRLLAIATGEAATEAAAPVELEQPEQPAEAPAANAPIEITENAEPAPSSDEETA